MKMSRIFLNHIRVIMEILAWELLLTKVILSVGLWVVEGDASRLSVSTCISEIGWVSS